MLLTMWAVILSSINNMAMLCLIRIVATSISLFNMDNRRNRCFFQSRASLSQRSRTLLQKRNTRQAREHLKAMICCIREEDSHSLQKGSWRHLLMPETLFNTIPLTAHSGSISKRGQWKLPRMINSQETQLARSPNYLSSIS